MNQETEQKVLTKEVALNGKTIKLYSLNGLTWLSSQEQMHEVMTRLENTRISLAEGKVGDQMSVIKPTSPRYRPKLKAKQSGGLVDALNPSSEEDTIEDGIEDNLVAGADEGVDLILKIADSDVEDQDQTDDSDQELEQEISKAEPSKKTKLRSSSKVLTTELKAKPKAKLKTKTVAIKGAKSKKIEAKSKAAQKKVKEVKKSKKPKSKK